MSEIRPIPLLVQAKRSISTMGLCSGTLFALCSGIVAEQKRLHLRFQANTIRHRRVLSLFQLGKLILSAPDPPKLSQLELNTAARLIKAYEIIHQFVGVHECGTYFGTLYPVPLKGRPALYSGTLFRSVNLTAQLLECPFLKKVSVGTICEKLHNCIHYCGLTGRYKRK